MLKMMIDHSLEIAPYLVSYDWTFAWAADRTSYVTSDDPFLILNDKWQAPAAYSSGVGITMEGAQKVLPLNQHLCLVIGTGALATQHIRLARKAVRELNLQQFRHYNRWLIARDKALIESIFRRRG